MGSHHPVPLQELNFIVFRERSGPLFALAMPAHTTHTRPMSTEAWRWGDMFELDVPLSAEVRDLGEMVELRFAEEPATPLLLAAFSPLPTSGGPEQAVHGALERFALSRGFGRGSGPLRPELSVDPQGVVAGRLAFVTDLAWEVLAIAWNNHLVVAFSAAARPDAGIFDRAEALLASLRPGELIVSGTYLPEAAGDF